MADKELNIKSSTIEKGLDLAKDFLGKLISPTIEEVGLLVSDNIKYLRFKNQVRILLKAKRYVDEKKISLKEIPIKILVPLLEKASLEEQESLQDKWVNMLVNMVDSERNLQNQIFPHILSQISIQEFEDLKATKKAEDDFIILKQDLVKLLETDKFGFDKKTKECQRKVDEVEKGGFSMNLQEFEIANILRLGLIRQLPPEMYIDEFKTGSNSPHDSREEWHYLDIQYDPYNCGYRITELGTKFLEICE